MTQILVHHHPPQRLSVDDLRSMAPGLTGSLGLQVQRWISAIFDYDVTPLVPLPSLANAVGVGAIHIKDEGARLGLRSFKALGGAYAVIRLVYKEAERLGFSLEPENLVRSTSGSLDLPLQSAPVTGHGGSAGFRQAAKGLTFACATDGNHGQSVAAGARLVGARAVIFVHQGVSPMRREAIARFGAEIREVPGNYDDAVAEASAQAQKHGWTLLSDTSWPGYEEIPMLVMQGYTLITHEIAQSLDAAPTHVFLQAGVGGFAAALAASMADRWPDDRPVFIIVEPDRAACLLASAQRGERVRIDAHEETVMSMLECYEPSMTAWALLDRLANAFVSVSDAEAVAAMRTLALDLSPEETVLAGESGAAGLAGLNALMADPAAAGELGLNRQSRVLLINTESATDPARYLELVGKSPAEVVRQAHEVLESVTL